MARGTAPLGPGFSVPGARVPSPAQGFSVAGMKDPADFVAEVTALAPDYFFCAGAGYTMAGQKASAWDDLSGNLHHGSQATDDKRAVVKPIDARLGGAPSLQFSSGQGYVLDAGGGWPAGTDHTVLSVFYQGTSGVAESLLDASVGRLNVTNQAPGFLVGVSDGLGFRTVAPNQTGAQTVEWHIDDTANQVECFRDGASLGTAVWPYSRALGGIVGLGAAYTIAVNYFTGRIGCLVGWASQLSAPNLAALRAAVRSFYGSGVMP